MVNSVQVLPSSVNESEQSCGFLESPSVKMATSDIVLKRKLIILRVRSHVLPRGAQTLDIYSIYVSKDGY